MNKFTSTFKKNPHCSVVVLIGAAFATGFYVYAKNSTSHHRVRNRKVHVTGGCNAQNVTTIRNLSHAKETVSVSSPATSHWHRPKKYTYEDAIDMKRRLEGGESKKAIGMLYGVSPQTVTNAIKSIS